ncbi:hypothetical protein BDW42DRAFT_172427 [Aspergillus taichungensis]|uniref:Uncharacterized protein n=1 Tax=Aspergillus taichungensis TaxID=482145 RepID=A0A2J5HQV3_9EURO|nr:hypothetical protein BDW42DRAFT_172427 [Aspergillus taichungensis]
MLADHKSSSHQTAFRRLFTFAAGFAGESVTQRGPDLPTTAGIHAFYSLSSSSKYKGEGVGPCSSKPVVPARSYQPRPLKTSGVGSKGCNPPLAAQGYHGALPPPPPSASDIRSGKKEEKSCNKDSERNQCAPALLIFATCSRGVTPHRDLNDSDPNQGPLCRIGICQCLACDCMIVDKVHYVL